MKKLIPLLALVLCCLSCDPPFDLSLSQAAAVVSKMTLRQTLAPVYGIEGDQLGLDLVFLPEKMTADPGIDYQNGFLLMRDTNRALLRYIQYNGTSKSYQASGWWGADFINPDPSYFPFQVEPLKYGSNIGVVGLNPVSPQASICEILTVNFGPPLTLESPGGPKNLKDDFINAIGPGPLYDANVLGFSIYPTDFAQVFDDSYWLVRIANPPIDAGKLMEVSMSVNAGGLFTKADTKPGAALFSILELAGVNRCLYYYDPGRAQSYVSWFDTATESWRCISWKGTTANPETGALPGVTHRIDALLTTGRLFSTEGGVGRVYDSNGTEITSFALGALRFIGERYVDVDGVQKATVLFSLARPVNERYNQTLAIDVYSISTSDLEALGK